eukprot:403374651
MLKFDAKYLNPIDSKQSWKDFQEECHQLSKTFIQTQEVNKSSRGKLFVTDQNNQQQQFKFNQFIKEPDNLDQHYYHIKVNIGVVSIIHDQQDYSKVLEQNAFKSKQKGGIFLRVAINNLIQGEQQLEKRKLLKFIQQNILQVPEDELVKQKESISMKSEGPENNHLLYVFKELKLPYLFVIDLKLHVNQSYMERLSSLIDLIDDIKLTKEFMKIVQNALQQSLQPLISSLDISIKNQNQKEKFNAYLNVIPDTLIKYYKRQEGIRDNDYSNCEQNTNELMQNQINLHKLKQQLREALLTM